ncbi:MAG: hypothetical protein ACXWQE_00020 [Bdellovibrionales bacterium]
MEKIGIDNLKKVFAVLAALANLGDDVGRDTSPSRWAKLLSVITIVKDAASLDFKQALVEIKDLDMDERQALLVEIGADLKLGDAQLEKSIEDALAIVVDLDSVIERSVSMVKSFKA